MAESDHILLLSLMVLFIWSLPGILPFVSAASGLTALHEALRRFFTTPSLSNSNQLTSKGFDRNG